MANPSSSLVLVLLCLSAVLAMGCPTSPCECRPRKNETLRYFLHQFPALPGVPNPNEVVTTKGTVGPPVWFGSMITHDWYLTNGPSSNDKPVARVNGFHVQSSQTSAGWYTTQIIVFQEGTRFAGATLQALGLVPDAISGEWSITGGTGAFAMAQGIITWRASQSSTSIDAVKELEINVFYAPEIKAIQGAAII